MSSNDSIGTLRGLHFQLSPKTETKLGAMPKRRNLGCHCRLTSRVEFIRPMARPDFDHAENSDLVYVPERFAHGYITLEPNSEVM